MEKMVEQLFLIMEQGEEFEQLNTLLTTECKKRLQLLDRKSTRLNSSHMA